MTVKERTMQRLTLAVVLLAGSGLAGAQPTETTPAQPTTLAQPTGPAQPTRVEIRPVTAHEPTLVREGAFLSEMQGELRRSELGWVIDFAPDAETGERLASMILQPGMTRTAMEQIIAAHNEPIGFVVSGQVFVYHGRNYLLPTRFAIAARAEPEPTWADADSNPERDAEPPADVAPMGLPGMDDASVEPSVEGLLEDFAANPAETFEVPLAPAGSGSGAVRLREGTMIAQVRGRVLPGRGGDLVFTQDSDADTPPDAGPISGRGELPPMRMLPCLNLERLEKLRTEWGERLIVTMSGRVFSDAGRSLLLPTMYVIELERAGNLSLGQ